MDTVTIFPKNMKVLLFFTLLSAAIHASSSVTTTPKLKALEERIKIVQEDYVRTLQEYNDEVAKTAHTSTPKEPESEKDLENLLEHTLEESDSGDSLERDLLLTDRLRKIEERLGTLEHKASSAYHDADAAYRGPSALLPETEATAQYNQTMAMFQAAHNLSDPVIREGEFKKVLAALEEVIKKDGLGPVGQKARLHKGHVLMERGDYRGAEKSYREALALFKEASLRGMAEMGIVQALLKSDNKAKACEMTQTFKSEHMSEHDRQKLNEILQTCKKTA